MKTKYSLIFSPLLLLVFVIFARMNIKKKFEMKSKNIISHEITRLVDAQSQPNTIDSPSHMQANQGTSSDLLKYTTALYCWYFFFLVRNSLIYPTFHMISLLSLTRSTFKCEVIRNYIHSNSQFRYVLGRSLSIKTTLKMMKSNHKTRYCAQLLCLSRSSFYFPLCCKMIFPPPR